MEDASGRRGAIGRADETRSAVIAKRLGCILEHKNAPSLLRGIAASENVRLVGSSPIFDSQQVRHGRFPTAASVHKTSEEGRQEDRGHGRCARPSTPPSRACGRGRRSTPWSSRFLSRRRRRSATRSLTRSAAVMGVCGHPVAFHGLKGLPSMLSAEGREATRVEIGGGRGRNGRAPWIPVRATGSEVLLSITLSATQLGAGPSG
jgi:hypothetical protein